MTEHWSYPRTGRASRRFRFVLAGVAGLCLVATAAAQADDMAAGDMSVTGAWFRTLVANRPAGGYFVLENGGDNDRMLIGASSPACAKTMLHRTTEENGVAKMLKAGHVEVPAHGSIAFEPGGYHIMCMKPGDRMKPGNTVPVTLKFADGATLSVDFDVRSATGK